MLLSSDEDGYVTLRGDATDVPLELQDLALEVASSCPEGAVTTR
jgi:hypothetical protein